MSTLVYTAVMVFLLFCIYRVSLTRKRFELGLLKCQKCQAWRSPYVHEALGESRLYCGPCGREVMANANEYDRQWSEVMTLAQKAAQQYLAYTANINERSKRKDTEH